MLSSLQVLSEKLHLFAGCRWITGIINAARGSLERFLFPRTKRRTHSDGLARADLPNIIRMQQCDLVHTSSISASPWLLSGRSTWSAPLPRPMVTPPMMGRPSLLTVYRVLQKAPGLGFLFGRHSHHTDDLGPFCADDRLEPSAMHPVRNSYCTRQAGGWKGKKEWGEMLEVFRNAFWRGILIFSTRYCLGLPVRAKPHLCAGPQQMFDRCSTCMCAVCHGSS